MSTGKNCRVIITALGSPEVLKYIEEDIPNPKPGEVRVKVLAAGVSFADVLMRHGLYPGAPNPPFTPGYDIVGEVHGTGGGVSLFPIGQRVAGMIGTGGYSQYVLVPEAELVPISADIDPAEAVCMILNYVTAYQMLHRTVKVSKGQRVLIHSAAGGVGTALLQLGALAELSMYGTSSKSKHAAVVSEGGVPIDYKSEDFVSRVREATGEGVDAVFDPIGGWNWWRSYRALRKDGTLVCYGVSTSVSHGKMLGGGGSFLLMGILKCIPDGKKCVWYSVTTVRKQRPEWFREDLLTLLGLLAERKIHPVIAARLPLKDAATANEWIENSKAIGKIVLMCQA
jgi:NADPH:quinone reductase-like Zn-dependent oxidoreductase